MLLYCLLDYMTSNNELAAIIIFAPLYIMYPSSLDALKIFLNHGFKPSLIIIDLSVIFFMFVQVGVH